MGLKMVNFLLGQQSDYRKYPCFLCMLYLYSTFLGMSMEKNKAETFNGPQIRRHKRKIRVLLAE